MGEELQNVYRGLERNPTTGDWRRSSDNRRPITARIGPENSRYMGSGSDQFHLQNQFKWMPIWDDPRTKGMDTAEGLAQQGRNRGEIYNPLMGGWMADTTFNRTQPIWGGQGGQFNPYRQSGGMGQQGMAPNPNEPARNAQGLTEQQKRWGDFVQANKLGGQWKDLEDSKFANPYAGTREQNIANAKAAGEFDAIKDAYNRDAVGSGYRMDDNGNISRGAPLVQNGNRFSIPNPYGPAYADIPSKKTTEPETDEEDDEEDDEEA